MKQLIHKPGESLLLEEVPLPSATAGRLLVRTEASLLSPGTEKAKLTPQPGALRRILDKPELIGKGMKALRERGLKSTLDMTQKVLAKPPSLPSPMGYSLAGVVQEAADAASTLRPGQRVACAGAGWASHAEFNAIPEILCVAVPDGVSAEDASFTTLGAIAMQGLRQTAPTLGENVAVIGLGLIGQLTVQLLKANGCRVLAADLDEQRLDLSRKLGADLAPTGDIHEAAQELSRGRGLDAVIITAHASGSDLVRTAGELLRHKGRVVAVGNVGMDIPRNLYYEKELDFRLSMSYGPGRYDPDYELRGHDYPYAYVRWTEQRNMEAFLQQVQAGSVTPASLVTHRFAFTDAAEAYAVLEGDEPSMGIVFEYDSPAEDSVAISIPQAVERGPVGPRLAVLGAGAFARKVLFPRLKNRQVDVATVATASGLSARAAAEFLGAESATSDYEQILGDSSVNAVMVLTRHAQHPEHAARALLAGKDVFLEKPVAIDEEGLARVGKALVDSGGRLFLGFNRRFSPYAIKLREHFGGAGPLSMVYRINAGAVPVGSWIQNADEGGGRIVGEVCHFVDLLSFLCGSAPLRAQCGSARLGRDDLPDSDHLSATLDFANGSIGTIHYFASGAETLTKEYLEVHGGGRSAVLDDFRRLDLYDEQKKKSIGDKHQDKGFDGEIDAFLDCLRGGLPAPIPFDQLERTTQATFAIEKSLRLGTGVDLPRSRHGDDLPPSAQRN